MLNILETVQDRDNGILIGTYTRPTQQCNFEWPWPELLSKISTTRRVARPLCDATAELHVWAGAVGRPAFYRSDDIIVRTENKRLTASCFRALRITSAAVIDRRTMNSDICFSRTLLRYYTFGYCHRNSVCLSSVSL